MSITNDLKYHDDPNPKQCAKCGRDMPIEFHKKKYCSGPHHFCSCDNDLVLWRISHGDYTDTLVAIERGSYSHEEMSLLEIVCQKKFRKSAWWICSQYPKNIIISFLKEQI